VNDSERNTLKGPALEFLSQTAYILFKIKIGKIKNLSDPFNIQAISYFQNFFNISSTE